MVLIAVAERWKQLRWPSADEWINEMKYRHTMEHSLALGRKEVIVTHGIKRTRLEESMLNERIQKRTNIVWFHL